MMGDELAETTLSFERTYRLHLGSNCAIVHNTDDSESGILREDPMVKWHQTLTPEKPRE